MPVGVDVGDARTGVFVRGDDPDTDVQVFWRQVGPDGPGEDEPEPVRRELCNVPIGGDSGIRAFLKKDNVVGYV